MTTTGEAETRLAGLLAALANPVRLQLVRRLQRPAFIPDLTRELGLSRQAIKKHLDELVDAGIVAATMRRRGALPAAQYATDPAGFFALREMVADLGPSQASGLVARPTMVAGPEGRTRLRHGRGLLMVHGDVVGRWFPLSGQTSWILGRDAGADVALPYDGFASQRHAMLQRKDDAWTLSDLHSTNGTAVNFVPIQRGATVDIAHGDLLTIGRTHLALRDA